MASYENITHLTVQNLRVLGDVELPDGTIPEPATVEAVEPVEAPAPLPEKLTMVALGEYLEALTTALVTAGVLKNHEGAKGTVEAAE
ncbi:hypothetical protein SEA_WHEELBITE_26 [Arthrobacter phage Wheelbite]|uniref:Uncharacterized protein n=1 Tax=Arthrobacter phage Wheelbite TaxID=2015873 RepID=A0A222ZIF1_9CAUD|nr:hypothetical protein KMD23_gp26 [Arthrobacter phage Wheelbite]ASR84119.1 hypothetical protein SEA_WHEELBITE_26 [Arthrobacter phage Wheelbite]